MTAGWRHEPMRSASRRLGPGGAVSAAVIRLVHQSAGDTGVHRTLQMAGERRSVAELQNPAGGSSTGEIVALLRAGGQVADDPDFARHVGQEILRQQVGAETAELLWESRPAGADDEPVRLRRRVQQLTTRLRGAYASAAGLLAGGDADAVLARLADGAADAVGGAPLLLVVKLADGAERLHQRGFGGDEAAAVARHLLDERVDPSTPLVARGGSALVADVVSPRRRYGRMAAVFDHGTAFLADEQQLLQVYAHYAATALDAVTTLGDARHAEDRARALLDFARALPTAASAQAVAHHLAQTVPVVIGCERSTVLLWDDERQALVRRAQARATAKRRADAAPGPDTPAAAHLAGQGEPAELVVPRRATDAMEQLLHSKDVLVVDRATHDGYLRQLLEDSGTATTVLAPLVAGDELLGVVAANFDTRPGADLRRDHELHERLGSLADQAVTALQNMRLLEQVSHHAWHDSLTALPNRRLLEDRVNQELRRAERSGEGLGVLFIDLDQFKQVNDTLGHAAGDELLHQVARRLCDTVRQQDTVARLGGDEFAVLLPGLSDPDAAEQLARRALEVLDRPYPIGEHQVRVSASIGVALAPRHGTSYDELLSAADAAMYRSKALGRDTFELFDPQRRDSPAPLGPASAGGDPHRRAPAGPVDDAGVLHSAPGEPTEAADRRLAHDLQRAVEHGQLFVVYQPVVDLPTTAVVGVEALVRWRHPHQGILPPAVFIPVAEASDVGVRLDAWVVHQACRQVGAWTALGLPPLRVAVNVSARDLRSPAFVAEVVRGLDDSGLDPDLLELELPEQVVAAGSEALEHHVEQLRSHGVRFAVDGFGAGGATLSRIGRFPLSTLKIDRSVVHDVTAEADPGQPGRLVAAITALARNLGVDCIAAGVETTFQSRMLLAGGCSTAQGFFYSPPLPPADVEQLLLVKAARLSIPTVDGASG